VNGWHTWVLELEKEIHWPLIVQKVSPPHLLLGMDFAIGVQVEPSILLGIEENILSWPGRVATISHIVVGCERLVSVDLAMMFHSTPM
jgi:hypothetical protein